LPLLAHSTRPSRHLKSLLLPLFAWVVQDKGMDCLDQFKAFQVRQ
jgi:hypothetical protein